MNFKKFQVKLIDLHDKFQQVERTIEVSGVHSEYAAELHALQQFKGLKVNRDLSMSPFVPNGKVKVVSVKLVEDIASKEF